MKNAPKLLIPLLLLACVSVQANAQPRCNVETPLDIKRVEQQHEKLLATNDPAIQKIALANIAGLAKLCDGKITFERLIPTLVRLYDKSEPESQVVVADALYAVNEATALRNLQRTLRGIGSRTHSDALWAHILQSRQEERSIQ